jgi:hypothetical protein
LGSFRAIPPAWRVGSHQIGFVLRICPVSRAPAASSYPAPLRNWLCFTLHTSNFTLPTSSKLGSFRTIAIGLGWLNDRIVGYFVRQGGENWLCFARLPRVPRASCVRPAPGGKLGLFGTFRPPGRRIGFVCTAGSQSLAARDWLCFTLHTSHFKLLPIGFVCTIPLVPRPQAAPNPPPTGSWVCCRNDTGQRGVVARLAPANWLCLYSQPCKPLAAGRRPF